MKHHLQFRNLHPSIVGAAERVLQAKPWNLDDEEQEEVAREFLHALGNTYAVPMPEFKIDPYMYGSYNYTEEEAHMDSFDTLHVDRPALIRVADWSILTLFYLGRVHLVACGAASPVGDPDYDARGWACSLFYRVRPVSFRRLAREGRIVGVTARDTYTSASWQKLSDAGVTDGYDSLTVSNEAARDIISETPQPSDEEPAMIDTQDDNSDEAHAIAEAAEATLPEGIVIGEDERAEISSAVDGLDSLNRDQIRALAVANGIARGDRNKDQLIAALRDAGVSA